jgi:hypothetical protein
LLALRARKKAPPNIPDVEDQRMPLPRAGLCSLLALALLAAAAGGREPRQDETTDLNDLALEVDALQGLHSLKLTDAQLQRLRGLARETAAKPGKRTAARASKEYRAKLLELRAALVEASDSDRIDRLGEELEDLRVTEKPVLDNGVNLTAAARKRTPEVLRSLKVQQVRDYLDSLEDDLGDPLDRLLAALESLRGLKGKEWEERRDTVADDVVRLAAGIDAKKADKLSGQVTALLNKAHGLSAADFKAKRPELEKTARKLLGDPGPLEVLRNAVEYALAELLSNPRLPAALEARLKNAK